MLNALNAKVLSLNARDLDGAKSTAVVTVEGKTLADLEVIIAKLRTVAGVTEITRSGD